MKRVSFKYVKDDGSTSERELLSPLYLKESSNSLKQFDKEDVKYIRGYELNKEGLSEEEIVKYEETLVVYNSLSVPTIKDYFLSVGLDPSKLSEKAFKKQNISEFKEILN